ncbi:hypothetical protein AVEN_84956-1 [Araneus ventricosus]|uniref:Uncharacterized protein n=1 Tax=Araneus ventricosus TaxID=182803 RepID=A0A4Y2C0K0_ARAVE|nr:hypothetical protein AVEN_84956-1 [Araneus ventricosus]
MSIPSYLKLNRVILALPWHSGFLNDRHCNSSSTEAGVLIVIIDRSRRKVTRLQLFLYPREARTRLLILRLLIREFAVPLGSLYQGTVKSTFQLISLSEIPIMM